MATANGDLDSIITVKVLFENGTQRVKMPLRDATPTSLEKQLRTFLRIPVDWEITIERFSDSAGNYVVLDPSNTPAYKQLYRAAKAKSKLKLRVTRKEVTVGVTEDPIMSIKSVPSGTDVVISCNSCDSVITDVHYHCSTCEDGDFDLCQTCVDQGISCNSSEHWLIKRTTQNGHLVTSTATNSSASIESAHRSAAKHKLHGLAEDVKNESSQLREKKAAAKDLAHSAICDHCNKFIVGVRHKCIDCPDWDYCSECVPLSATIHPKHRFLPIYDALQLAHQPDATNDLPIHTGICCDGPLCSARKESGYIRGIRYKCTVCDDVDYCASCEANPKTEHNITHPLLKFKTPVRQVSVTTHGEHLDGRKMPAMGDKPKLNPFPANIHPKAAAAQIMLHRSQIAEFPSYPTPKSAAEAHALRAVPAPQDKDAFRAAQIMLHRSQINEFTTQPTPKSAAEAQALLQAQEAPKSAAEAHALRSSPPTDVDDALTTAAQIMLHRSQIHEYSTTPQPKSHATALAHRAKDSPKSADEAHALRSGPSDSDAFAAAQIMLHRSQVNEYSSLPTPKSHAQHLAHIQQESPKSADEAHALRASPIDSDAFAAAQIMLHRSQINEFSSQPRPRSHHETRAKHRGRHTPKSLAEAKAIQDGPDKEDLTTAAQIMLHRSQINEFSTDPAPKSLAEAQAQAAAQSAHKSADEAQAALAADGEASIQITKVEPKPINNQDLRAVFVSDTIQDGTILPANTTFEQTWVLRNEGTVAWPAGCSVKFVGGDYMGQVDSSHPAAISEIVSASESTVCYQALAPGQTFSFTVLLRTPARAGKVISYWRLTTKEGHKFGHRLWCDINVRANTEAAAKKETNGMIFPKVETEPTFSTQVEPKPAAQSTAADDGDDDDSADDFLTDEEYDILDASDEEFWNDQQN